MSCIFSDHGDSIYKMITQFNINIHLFRCLRNYDFADAYIPFSLKDVALEMIVSSIRIRMYLTRRIRLINRAFTITSLFGIKTYSFVELCMVELWLCILLLLLVRSSVGEITVYTADET